MAVQTPPRPATPDREIDAGVIEDARRRQRRQRAAGAAVVGALAAGAIIFAAVGGGGGSGALQSGHGHGSSGGAATQNSSRGVPAVPGLPDGVDHFGLLTPRVGWVTGQYGVYMTRDGGRTWAKPQLKALAGELAGFALAGSSSPNGRALMLSFNDSDSVTTQRSTSGSTAVKAVTVSSVSSASANRTCADHSDATAPNGGLTLGQIAVSTDGGRTWTSHPFPACEAPASISFVNNRVGFVLAHGTAPGPTRSLYQTSDGASSWTRVAKLPFEGLISFANAKDGLGGGWSIGAGLVDSAAIYRTSNGGRSWARTPLCRPTGYTCEAPHLFASGRGVVLVSTQKPQTNLTTVDVYTTRDNGRRWAPHTLPDTPALTNSITYIPFSAPNANDLFAWVSPYLYRSTNGGISWSRSTEHQLVVPAATNFSDLAFVNATYGWYDDLNVFDRTADAGQHWTELGS
jgi:photosystem II stability/assembly factor-like uncharacterized protein